MRVLLLSFTTLALGSPLSDELLAMQFLHTGRVNATSSFSFFPINAGYLEPENVSCSMCGWGKGGAFPYLYDTSGSAPSYTCKGVGPLMNDTDLPGGDLDAYALPAGSTATTCQQHCCARAGCSAFTFAAKAPAAFISCNAGDICCYLKNGGEKPNAFPGLVSGTVTPGDPPALAAPDFGMRSAVPLGGLGAGTFELRGDGTFHELTIHNAHPSGQGKLGVLADALLGLRVDGPSSVARAIRTHAPAYAPSGVEALEYSGAYPASRLSVVDAQVGTSLSSAQVFAYPVFTPGSEATMAHPAVAFSLVATNALATAVNVSLYMALPWGAINDCDRTGDGKNTLVTQPGLTLAQCLLLARNTSGCAAWTWKEDPQDALGTCTLTSDTNLFRGGKSSCGVTGGWVQSSTSAITFVADANGNSPTSPSLGDTTLMAATAEAVDTQLLFANSPGDLWSAFANPAAPPPGVASPTSTPAPGGWGSLSTTITLPPGATGEVTLIWSWHFREFCSVPPCCGACCPPSPLSLFLFSLPPSPPLPLPALSHTGSPQGLVARGGGQLLCHPLGGQRGRCRGAGNPRAPGCRCAGHQCPPQRGAGPGASLGPPPLPHSHLAS